VTEEDFNRPVNDLSLSAENRETKREFVLVLPTTVGREGELRTPVIIKLMTTSKIVLKTVMYKHTATYGPFYKIEECYRCYATTP
jgi:hypothetical protein